MNNLKYFKYEWFITEQVQQLCTWITDSWHHKFCGEVSFSDRNSALKMSNIKTLKIFKY